jgi:hypothetical protein
MSLATETAFFTASEETNFAATLFGTHHEAMRPVEQAKDVKDPANRLAQLPCSNFPFHCYSRANKKGIGTVRYPRQVPRDAACAVKLAKRTLTALYNERPTWLSLAHEKLDAAVATAYGWPPDLKDEDLLARLLELNLARPAVQGRGVPEPDEE